MRLGRTFAIVLALDPRRHSGHAESLNMLRGDRWNEWPFSQRHQAERKLRARMPAASPFLFSSQSLLSSGWVAIDSATVPPS